MFPQSPTVSVHLWDVCDPHGAGELSWELQRAAPAPSRGLLLLCDLTTACRALCQHAGFWDVHLVQGWWYSWWDEHLFSLFISHELPSAEVWALWSHHESPGYGLHKCPGLLVRVSTSSSHVRHLEVLSGFECFIMFGVLNFPRGWHAVCEICALIRRWIFTSQVSSGKMGILQRCKVVFIAASYKMKWESSKGQVICVRLSCRLLTAPAPRFQTWLSVLALPVLSVDSPPPVDILDRMDAYSNVYVWSEKADNILKLEAYC